MDIIFDRYFERSLKKQTRTDRGISGTRILNINDEMDFPKNFQESFLRNPDNKNDLSDYLAPKMISLHHESGSRYVHLNATHKSSIISSNAMDVTMLMSNSEEADQKIVRHALHCIDANCNLVVVKSIDHDVFILLIAYVAKRSESVAIKCDIYFKLISSSPTWYNISNIVESHGKDVCEALPFFFAFTGCDNVSSFHGKGKCTLFDAWMNNSEKEKLTQTFIKLGCLPESVSDNDIDCIEVFVKNAYFGNVKNLTDVSLNELRKDQFIRTISNDVRKIAPSSSALYMHTLRATYQAGYLCVECAKNVELPDPCLWGI